jgi:hypothetical protein
MDPVAPPQIEESWEADLEAEEVELVANLTELAQVVERRQQER